MKKKKKKTEAEDATSKQPPVTGYCPAKILPVAAAHLYSSNYSTVVRHIIPLTPRTRLDDLSRGGQESSSVKMCPGNTGLLPCRTLRFM